MGGGFKIIFIFTIVILVFAGIYSKKMNKKAKDVKIVSEDIINKSVNMTYISELKKLNINALDENICTINIVDNLSKTDKIKLLTSLCENLNIKIEQFFIKDNTFLTCLKGDYFSSLMLDDKKITITSQNFEFLLVLNKQISTILNE